MIQTRGRGLREINTAFTFTRPSTATQTVDGRTVGVDQPRYAIGKFGFGLQVEEGTLNLAPSNIQTYTFADWASGTGGTVQDGTTPWGTPYRAVIPVSTNSTNLVVESPTFTLNSPAGAYYVGSFAYLVTGGTDTVYVGLRSTDAVYYSNSTNVQLIKIVDMPGGWKRVYYAFPQVPTTYTGATTFNFITRFGSNTTTVYFADPQLEAKWYPTSFTNGFRDNEVIIIPVDSTKFTGDHFTLEAWFYPTSSPNATDAYLFNINNNGATAGRFDLKFTNGANKQIVWEYYDGTSPYTFYSTNYVNMNAWNYVAWGYDRTSNTQYINLNGTKTVPTTPPVIPAFGAFTQILAGTDYNKAGNRGNIVVDDIRLSNIARTDADIATSSGGTAPMVKDLNTTLKLSSDFPNTVYLNGSTSL
jgi:hypothetical protein